MNQIQVGYIADQDLGPKSAYNYRDADPDPNPNGYAGHKIQTHPQALTLYLGNQIPNFIPSPNVQTSYNLRFIFPFDPCN